MYPAPAPFYEAGGQKPLSLRKQGRGTLEETVTTFKVLQVWAWRAANLRIRPTTVYFYVVDSQGYVNHMLILKEMNAC